MTAATQQAVETAIRKGEKMHGEYDVIALEEMPGSYIVQHKEQVKRCYLVDTRKGREKCQCLAWQREGVCKHQWFVDETLRIEEGEAQAQAEEEGWACAVCGTAVLFHRFESCERCAKRSI